jgi:predicted AAA+ superfamily ATPase
MKTIIDLCYDYNPWWIDSAYQVDESNLIKREIFQKGIEYLSLPQIEALVGLRRTGKTTILKQLIAKLLREGTPPPNILFFPFEESGVTLKEESLEEVLYAYTEKFLRKKIYEVNEKTYLVLDEVQYVPAWQDILKRFYDANKNFKFVISGSSSLFIREESKESLAGRVMEIACPPFSFAEFLKLKKMGAFPHFVPTFEMENLTQEKSQIEQALRAFSDKGQAWFVDYLIKGEFPEAIDFPLVTFREYLNASIWSKIIEKDIPKIYKVEKVDELKNIFLAACRESADIFSPASWSQDFGVSLPTLDNYLGYLEKANLLKVSLNFSKGFRRGPRSLKKIFVASPNFTAAALGLSDKNPLFMKVAGKLAETAVFNVLSRLADVYFWRVRDKEVDFILSFPQGVLPVEVKYQSRITTAEISSLLAYCKKKKLSRALVITKDEIGLDEIQGISVFKVPILAVV